MEGSGNDSSYNQRALVKSPSELETLQKQHVERTVKIQELKKQIEALKLRSEKKTATTAAKKSIADERREAFKNLSEKYNSRRKEYDALLSDRSRVHKLI
ncbi:hypothetical protein V6N13_056129 [Hibiscus sabdariffa]|uniref:Uncharacterized protein n=1 Tax=Hibiscus sabdariffa TaxID=183260 RepID=A0ABR2BCG5_9ROSI